VSRAMRGGRLQVFGWYYDILSGRIEQFDEDERKFVGIL
jgi:carbonic anhydrase